VAHLDWNYQLLGIFPLIGDHKIICLQNKKNKKERFITFKLVGSICIQVPPGPNSELVARVGIHVQFLHKLANI
jgi:hypothetical protein